MELAGRQVVVIHGHQLGSPTPARFSSASGADIIVYGHAPADKREIDGCLVLNRAVPVHRWPSSFLMLLHIEDDGLRTELVEL